MPEKVKRTLSQSVRGSMTVEASIVLPLFLIFFINLSSSIEMIRLSGKLDTALWSIGSDLSYYGVFLTNPVKEMGATGHIKKREEEHKEEDESPGEEKSGNDKENEIGKEILREMGDIVLSYTYVKNRIVKILGEEYLDSSPIRGGKDGLCFLESDIIGNDIVDIGVTYSVSPPIDMGNLLRFRMSNRYYAHLWNGYKVGDSGDEEDKDITVYITKDSEVYHTSASCTYLKLSVRPVALSSLPYERNSSGARYGRCLLCTWEDPPDTIYICDEGGKYHYSRNCYSLKREYTAVKLSTVQATHRTCSRCGGFHGTGRVDMRDNYACHTDLADCA